MQCDPITGFKVKFNILDYVDILPEHPENYEDILNYDKPSHLCKWEYITPPKILTSEWKQQEITRVLRTGVWIFIKNQPVWIPPFYYFFLQYFQVMGKPAEFRLKRLKHVYFKIRVRKNNRSIGTFTMKNRQDGETTMAMAEVLWQILDGNMDFGAIAMQSKTRQTVVESCWRVLIMGFNGVPRWLKYILLKGVVSEDKLATKLQIRRTADEDNDVAAKDILVTFGASTHNAFDSMSNMQRCILDEFCKWEECSPYATFLNYEKFIAPGMARKGLFDIFSSPPDKLGRYNDEIVSFWKGSDGDKLTEYGSTETRIYRYYSNPLEGIEQGYDEYGDADADEIFAHIMRRRKSLPADQLLGEIRGYPLNEGEMFGSYEGSGVFTNTQGIKERVIFLTGNRFKNNDTREPIKVYGNLERVGGYIDGDVEFRQSALDTFDLKEARFCFSFMPQNKEDLKSIFSPPSYVERVVGIDPFNNRYEAKNVVRQSNGAMVGRQFRDLFETGVINVPVMTYCCRTQHQEEFFEDCIKAAIFNRALLQVESKSDKLANYAEDRGYSDWLLNEMGDTTGLRKGDAPASGGGKNVFLSEGIGLADSNTNLPLNGSPYYLENHWHSELLEDYLALNPLDTHANDLFMADVQALVGCVKIMHKKVRKPSQFNEIALNYFN